MKTYQPRSELSRWWRWLEELENLAKGAGFGEGAAQGLELSFTVGKTSEFTQDMNLRLRKNIILEENMYLLPKLTNARATDTGTGNSLI